MSNGPKRLAALREEIAAGRTKAADLAAGYYERIEKLNPRLNVFLSLTKERAFEQAARIDAMAAKGDPLPPLAGVPVGIKDVLVTQGAPSTAGSKILQGYRPPYDCTAVARLEAAGAVLLGKTNCDEFAMGSSNENSAYGPVRNPVDPERVPGGSSGGSAAAVAANLAVATLGTDTGGSIRQPASFCGVVGVLPTYGRVSRYGLIAFASSLDRIGPLAANVRDAATLLGVIAGHDPSDATSSPAPVPDFAAESDKPAAGLRIGVPAEYFGEGLDPEVRAAVEKGIAALEAAGCAIKPISLPHTKYAVPTYYLVATAEASANLARFDGVRYGYRSPTPPRSPTCIRTPATRASAPRSSAASSSAPTRFRPAITTLTTSRRSRFAAFWPRNSCAPLLRSMPSSRPLRPSPRSSSARKPAIHSPCISPTSIPSPPAWPASAVFRFHAAQPEPACPWGCRCLPGTWARAPHFAWRAPWRLRGFEE